MNISNSPSIGFNLFQKGYLIIIKDSKLSCKIERVITKLWTRTFEKKTPNYNYNQ